MKKCFQSRWDFAGSITVPLKRSSEVKGFPSVLKEVRSWVPAHKDSRGVTVLMCSSRSLKIIRLENV